MLSFDQISRDIRKQGLDCVTEHNRDRGDNFCRIVFPGISETYKLGDPRKKIWIKIDIQQNKTSYKHEISLFLIEKRNASRVKHFYPWLRSIDFEVLGRLA